MIVLNEVLYAEEWLEKDVPWKKAVPTFCGCLR